MVVQAAVIVVAHPVLQAQRGETPANRTVITRLQIAGVAVRRIISDKAVVRLVEAVDAPEADVTMLVPTVN
ncbi:hypothetical protein A3N57_17510 [Enterobacter cloacae subsp. dissolvens]|uniref:Uncharacterized protein n=1 Tax=Enterobacter cloacae TaxID=550 RepID=A0A3R9FV63_ENTCL|nr:hypothetical protein OA44_22045 [Enterobacter cloacae]KZP69690.1 hypothetical protein A3N40_07325 [Enterobacter cloacae subsp. dissolvens]KZQ37723.1 hypothetical protein A3N57_17510 [Enterobacter cloacae subsp. dissolvens]RSB29791.1 hypothetical protein EGK68_14695 [Enterobacter cloacae]